MSTMHILQSIMGSMTHTTSQMFGSTQCMLCSLQCAGVTLTCGLVFGTVWVLDSQFELLDEVWTVEASLLPDIQQPLHVLLSTVISISARETHTAHMRKDKTLPMNAWSTREGELPGHVWAGIHQDAFEVFGELRTLFLTVLNHVISQIQERQLPVSFSWTTNTFYSI